MKDKFENLLQKIENFMFKSFILYARLEVAFVILVFQSVSINIERLVGITCFKVAFIIGVLLSFFLSFWFCVFVTHNAIIVCAFLISFQIQTIVLIRKALRLQKSFNALPKTNAIIVNVELFSIKRSVSHLVNTVITLLIFPYEMHRPGIIIFILLMIPLWGMYMMEAFISCTPLPPGGKSKFQELCHNLKEKIMSILEPSGGGLPQPA